MLLSASSPATYSQKGLTLVELMVSLAVLAIIVGLAAPSFTRMVASNRISSMTNEFNGTLKLARSEAIRRGHAVSLRSLSSSEPGNYAIAGWQVFTDRDPDGVPANPVTEGDGTVIRSTQSTGRPTEIVRVDRAAGEPGASYSISSSADRSFVSFTSRGALLTGSDAYFRICDSANREIEGRVVRVSAVGNVSLAETRASCEVAAE